MWIARWHRRKTTCPDCGNPIEECSDPERDWFPYRRICYATLERETAQAKLKALRKGMEWHDGTFTRWSKVRTADFPCPEGAGETIGVAPTDVTPWDEFTTKRDASPLPPSGLADVAEQVDDPEGDAADDEHGEDDPPSHAD